MINVTIELRPANHASATFTHTPISRVPNVGEHITFVLDDKDSTGAIYRVSRVVHLLRKRVANELDAFDDVARVECEEDPEAPTLA